MLRLLQQVLNAAVYVGLIVGQATACYAQEKLSKQQIDFFENEVRPILADNCIKCHGRDRQEGGLRLDTREQLLAGGDSGPAVVLDDLESSVFLSAIHYEDYEMPPSGQLPEKKLDVLTRWVATGAFWPSHAGDGAVELRTERKITDADREYWAFRPLAEHTPPNIQSPALAARIATEVDAFVAEQLEAAGLNFSDEADKRILMRRLYFDLIGVPPTVKEARRFMRDTAPGAYERLVDRLLKDRRYGEKWARHWLDLVRYAESDGYNQDAARPTAYLYRDWVIKAFNEDMPYDRFVAAQLAGDELEPDNPEMLAATGYLRCWIYEYNQRDVRTQWANVMNDITDVTGEVFFGVGMGCARCHDHKFDPLLQRDYFRLQASFASFLPVDDVPYGSRQELRTYRRAQAKYQKATQPIRDEIDALERPTKDAEVKAAFNKFPLDVRPILFKAEEQRDGFEQQLYDFAWRQVIEAWKKIDWKKKLSKEDFARREQLLTKLKEHDGLKPAEPVRLLAAGRVDAAPPETFIPPDQDNHPVEPAGFEVFGAPELYADCELSPGQCRTGSAPGRRTVLAQWINSPENPLPHRVIVNRIWQYHFGRGLVENASDFGRLGAPPTHPELLDWLAVWFLDHDRSFKQLHRLIVTSTVYRQSSRPGADQLKVGTVVDLSNRLLWRYPARRLDGEQLRDAMLVAAGSLSQQHSGPAAPHDGNARSVFTMVKRNKPHPFLTTFDAPDGNGSVAKRQVTTTPNQSLLLTNAAWPLSQAGTMASQLLAKTPRPKRQIQLAYERSLQRQPTGEELTAALDFLRRCTSEANGSATAAGDDSSNSDSSSSDAESGSQPAGESGDSGTDRQEEPSKKWSQSAQYQTALTDLCHVLFNSSEFLYLQ